MNITMSLIQLRALLVDVGSHSANKALSGDGLLKQYPGKNEAYKQYGGEILIDGKESLIHPNRDGCRTVKCKIDRLD